MNKHDIPIRGTPKIRWTAEEDSLLRQSVSIHGVTKWTIIAQMIPGRSSKQCRERWVGKISPEVSNTEWSNEEDTLIANLRLQYGNQWARIAKHLNGRSMIAVKNRWSCISKRYSNATHKKILADNKNCNKSIFGIDVDILKDLPMVFDHNIMSDDANSFQWF